MVFSGQVYQIQTISMITQSQTGAVSFSLDDKVLHLMWTTSQTGPELSCLIRQPRVKKKQSQLMQFTKREEKI